MSQVAVLDPLVAQQVAAGEVVDRPASVILIRLFLELTAPVQEVKDGVRYSAKKPKSEAAVPEEGDEPTVEPSPDEEDGKHMPKDRKNHLAKR